MINTNNHICHHPLFQKSLKFNISVCFPRKRRKQKGKHYESVGSNTENHETITQVKTQHHIYKSPFDLFFLLYRQVFPHANKKHIHFFSKRKNKRRITKFTFSSILLDMNLLFSFQRGVWLTGMKPGPRLYTTQSIFSSIHI